MRETLDRGASINLRNMVRGPATHRGFMTPMAPPDRPALADYCARLDPRPGFRAHGRNGKP
jgi:hypothetical protein